MPGASSSRLALATAAAGNLPGRLPENPALRKNVRAIFQSLHTDTDIG
jgi:hypothetical protein